MAIYNFWGMTFTWTGTYRQLPLNGRQMARLMIEVIIVAWYYWSDKYWMKFCSKHVWSYFFSTQNMTIYKINLCILFKKLHYLLNGRFSRHIISWSWIVSNMFGVKHFLCCIIWSKFQSFESYWSFKHWGVLVDFVWYKIIFQKKTWRSIIGQNVLGASYRKWRVAILNWEIVSPIN